MIINPPPQFKPSVFWKDCRTCRGTGELKSGHPDVSPVKGHKTGFVYPEWRGGMSGEIIADADRGICGICLGTGIILIL
jgi:hypothetical protein